MRYPIRRDLLRKGKSLKSCCIEKDHAKEAIHIEPFKAKKNIEILSAFQIRYPEFENLRSFRLRTIKVAPKYQRKGIASVMIQNILQQINKNNNIECICLNTRIAANKLNESNGFHPIGKQFENKSIGTPSKFY